ncbi:MAG: HAMP domain-containing histidine kinase, partial [Thermoleophilia bacterium]|nr:HAMP domain-containing histidine kinase [Thermoleophilia bacterium]
LTIAVRADGDAVRVSLADTGDGMDEETRARSFDPFFTTKGQQGSGLGLSTVYGIVTRRGGEVDVETSAGVGTTVTVSLPHAT